jgi:hypothetical protein
MACCVDDACPMHRAGDRAGHESLHSTTARQAADALPLTQAEADACCLASEADDTPRAADARVPVTSVVVIGEAPDFLQPSPAMAARLRPPLIQSPAAPIARHLLLSVLQI